MGKEVKKVETKDNSKIRRSRSGGFPTITLLEAIEMIKKGSTAGWTMSKDTFAKAIGGSTAKSGAFLVKLGSIRDYGLIDRGGNIEYTQLAREIIAPKTDDPSESQNKLKEAFLKSDVFKSLYEKINDGPGESSISTIANLGVHDFRISVLKKDLFAQNFISSAKQAGLVEDSTDGKIRVIRENTMGDKKENAIGDNFGFPGFPKAKQEVVSGNVINYTGNGWILNLKAVKPLSVEIRKMLFDISELLNNEK